MFREYKAIEHVMDMLHTLYIAGGVNDLTSLIQLVKKHLDKDIPAEYAVKTLRKLVKANVLKSSQMGYELADNAANLPLGSVMRIFALSYEDQALYKLEQLIFRKLDGISLKDYFDGR